MAPDRGNALSAPLLSGTSFQASDSSSSSTRTRSRSPLDADGNYIGNVTGGEENAGSTSHGSSKQPPTAAAVRARQAAFLSSRAALPQNLTVRGTLVGLAIGTVICLSNTYFGLQTGWISGMAMPASLLGFAWFRAVSRFLSLPFHPVENVLVQTVAGAVGTMPLGVGLVGVIPALEFMTDKDERGPVSLPLGKLIAWSVGVCFFGVFVAVPLRREVLVREKLKFPSGAATGLMISVLHADNEALEQKKLAEGSEGLEEFEENSRNNDPDEDEDARRDWKRNVRDMVIAFGGSWVYTIFSYFVPQIHNIPILGSYLANKWLWTLNPSPAYIGQGIIMGPATTIHMLLGAILGWAILSPLAKNKGWAKGEVESWTDGSKGWIVWVSLAIMLADSLVNLGWLLLRPIIAHGPRWIAKLHSQYKSGDLTFVSLLNLSDSSRGSYKPLGSSSARSGSPSRDHKPSRLDDEPEADAPAEHLPSQKMTLIGLGVSVVLCVAGTHIAFPGLIPLYATVLAVIFSLGLSVMGVRALGETDLNPVSGISKLTQLVFATVLPLTPASIPANLIAGAISESAALQAGDMMQDLKTGHLLGASPLAQFYGQLLGSAAGAVIASLVYKLYTSVYTIPDELFQVPTGHVWIFTARLVTGQGLPPKAGQAAAIAAAVWAGLTVLRLWLAARKSRFHDWVPGGIAVAVGMYNTPSFTLARTAGGVLAAYWTRKGGKEETLVILASGLILGEGVGSIVKLALASKAVPHL